MNMKCFLISYFSLQKQFFQRLSLIVTFFTYLIILPIDFFLNVIIGYIYFCCLHSLSAVIIMATIGTNSKGKLYFLGFFFSLERKFCEFLQILVEFARLNHQKISRFSNFTELNTHKKIFLVQFLTLFSFINLVFL